MDVKATHEEEEEDLFVFNDTIEGPNLEAREAFQNLRTAHVWTLPDINVKIPDINQLSDTAAHAELSYGPELLQCHQRPLSGTHAHKHRQKKILFTRPL
jgi:hypothetical protein